MFEKRESTGKKGESRGLRKRITQGGHEQGIKGEGGVQGDEWGSRSTQKGKEPQGGEGLL